MNDLPEPLVRDDVDLRDFPFTPMFRSRLFGSSFHARVSDAGWRAGVTLWLKSWDQMPAGTLPDDGIDLCRLAELGRDLKAWNKVAKEALWGWFKCSDGRLHHKTVAEGVLEAWDRKIAQRDRTEAARAARAAKRQQHTGANSATEPVVLSTTVSVTDSVTEAATENVTGSKGQGQGQGQGYIAAAQLAAAPRDQASAKRLEPHDDGGGEFRTVLAACIEALGDKHPADAVIGPIISLIHQGFNLKDVTATLRSEANRPRSKPIKTWALWAKIVAEALDAAPKAAPPKSDPDDPKIEFSGGIAWPTSSVKRAIAKWREDPRSWPAPLGLSPSHDNCQVPRHLIDEVPH